MTIKIDLLPAYVGMRRWLKRFIAFCVSLVAVVGGVLFVLYYQGEQKLTKIKTDLANIEPIAKQKEDADTAKAAATTESGPYTATVNFIVDAGQTGPARAALIDMIRRWIYNGALVSSIDISDGATMKMALALNNPDEYAQFLGILRKASVSSGGPLFSDLPSASGIPGFSASTPVAQPVAGPGSLNLAPPPPPTFPLSISAQGTLKNPPPSPPETVGPGAPAAGAPVPPGGPGGRPGAGPG